MPPTAPQPRPTPERVTRPTRLAAAARLVTGADGGSDAAGTAFIRRAKANGIDLKHFYAVFDDRRAARQSALIVAQPGRTAMIFLSGNGPQVQCGDDPAQHADRVALLQFAFDDVRTTLADRIALLQALPSPDETRAKAAFDDAGMIRLGDLLYLRRPLTRPGSPSPNALPEHVETRPLGNIDDPAERATLQAALERTYIDTLDCPGLCDMRSTPDVIDSHHATGVYDPSLWWLVFHKGEPEGCVLLARNPDQDAVELIYMGLGPDLRGKGLGGPLLEAAIARLQRTGLSTINCAVDARNTPARSMYARLGFTPFAERVAYVLPVTSA